MVGSSAKKDPTEISLPGSYALQILSLVERWSITSEQLLGELGLEEHALEEPDSRVPFDVIAALIRRARLLTGEPGLGILFGLQAKPNTYGSVAFASMSAATLGEATEIAIRFSPIVTTAYNLRLCRVDGMASVVMDERCDLGDARDFIVLGLLIGLRVIGCTLTGREPWRPIDVAMPEPSYYRRFSQLVPELRFDQPMHQIALMESDLALPLLTPDRGALRLAIAQCERSFQMLGLGCSIEERMLQLVLGDDGPLTFEKAAATLHVSPRTLKRRLAESDTTFSELLEKARRERAYMLLRSPEVSLDDVAERLGYSTVSNLIRAFRRWTGMTPTAYRRGMRKPSLDATGRA